MFHCSTISVPLFHCSTVLLFNHLCSTLPRLDVLVFHHQMFYCSTIRCPLFHHLCSTVVPLDVLLFHYDCALFHHQMFYCFTIISVPLFNHQMFHICTIRCSNVPTPLLHSCNVYCFLHNIIKPENIFTCLRLSHQYVFMYIAICPRLNKSRF